MSVPNFVVVLAYLNMIAGGEASRAQTHRQDAIVHGELPFVRPRNLKQLPSCSQFTRHSGTCVHDDQVDTDGGFTCTGSDICSTVAGVNTPDVYLGECTCDDPVFEAATGQTGEQSCTICTPEPPPPCLSSENGLACCAFDCTPQLCNDFIGDGKACGDPHFAGFDGTQFDVMGREGEVYSLISAPGVAVNARLGNVGHVLVANLWMTEISIVAGNVTISVALALDDEKLQLQSVRQDSMRRMSYSSLVDILLVTINGEDKSLQLKSDCLLHLSDNFTAFFPQAMHPTDPTDGPLVALSMPEMEATIFLETEGVLHLDIAVHIHNTISPAVHGLLGQTLSWSKELGNNRLQGSEDDYIVGSSYSTQFKYSQYNSTEEQLSKGRYLVQQTGRLAKSFAYV